MPPMTPKKPGRKPLTEAMTPAELAAEINWLLIALDNAETEEDKRALRRLLRTRGHKGGLGKRLRREQSPGSNR